MGHLRLLEIKDLAPDKVEEQGMVPRRLLETRDQARGRVGEVVTGLLHLRASNGQALGKVEEQVMGGLQIVVEVKQVMPRVVECKEVHHRNSRCRFHLNNEVLRKRWEIMEDLTLLSCNEHKLRTK